MLLLSNPLGSEGAHIPCSHVPLQKLAMWLCLAAGNIVAGWEAIFWQQVYIMEGDAFIFLYCQLSLLHLLGQIWDV